MNQNKMIIQKYADASEIWLLRRRKKRTKKDMLLDFAVALFSPLHGISVEADGFADMGGYLLVIRKEETLLVRMEHGSFEEQNVTGQCSGRKFLIGQNWYTKVRMIHG